MQILVWVGSGAFLGGWLHFCRVAWLLAITSVSFPIQTYQGLVMLVCKGFEPSVAQY